MKKYNEDSKYNEAFSFIIVHQIYLHQYI